jgi:hypothetical protein
MKIEAAQNMASSGVRRSLYRQWRKYQPALWHQHKRRRIYQRSRNGGVGVAAASKAAAAYRRRKHHRNNEKSTWRVIENMKAGEESGVAAMAGVAASIEETIGESVAKMSA